MSQKSGMDRGGYVSVWACVCVHVCVSVYISAYMCMYFRPSVTFLISNFLLLTSYF